MSMSSFISHYLTLKCQRSEFVAKTQFLFLKVNFTGFSFTFLKQKFLKKTFASKSFDESINNTGNKLLKLVS